jgi:3-oxoacyl-ACP reductase-like protein
MTKNKTGEITVVFDKYLAVERCGVEKLPDEAFKLWKKDAAMQIAEFILDHNLMVHSSRYDMYRNYTHEAFTLLVGRPQGYLP